jgi:methionine synthase II (cobalamin-independent)
MGRKSRAKRFRRALQDKLAQAGLQDKIVYVVSKDVEVRVPVIVDGAPKRDEGGQMVTQAAQAAHIKRMSARNPLRNLLKKLMRESDETIRAFLASK